MSEWVIVAIATIGLVVFNLESIHINFRKKGPDKPKDEVKDAPEEPKQLKPARRRKQLKK